MGVDVDWKKNVNSLYRVQHFQFRSVTVIRALSYLRIMFPYSLSPSDSPCKMYFLTFLFHFVRGALFPGNQHIL